MSESIPVEGFARSEFNRMLGERTISGIRKYGHPLSTYNGRNALQDLKEELIDAWQYLCQLELEQQAQESATGVHFMWIGEDSAGISCSCGHEFIITTWTSKKCSRCGRAYQLEKLTRIEEIVEEKGE